VQVVNWMRQAQVERLTYSLQKLLLGEQAALAFMLSSAACIVKSAAGLPSLRGLTEAAKRLPSCSGQNCQADGWALASRLLMVEAHPAARQCDGPERARLCLSMTIQGTSPTANRSGASSCFVVVACFHHVAQGHEGWRSEHMQLNR
jgi:hypothetical protein